MEEMHKAGDGDTSSSSSQHFDVIDPSSTGIFVTLGNERKGLPMPRPPTVLLYPPFPETCLAPQKYTRAAPELCCHPGAEQWDRGREVPSACGRRGP